MRFANCIESFHSVLKKEEIYLHTYQDSNEARRAIFEYIESWYKRKRIHSPIGYLKPQKKEAEELKKHYNLLEKKVMIRLCVKIVAETDLYETDKEVRNLIDWICLSEQIKENNNTIHNLTGEYKKIEPDCRE